MAGSPPFLRLVLAFLILAGGCRSVPVDAARVVALGPELGQLVMAGFRGTEVEGNAEVEGLLCRSRVGGVLLLGRNVVDAAQLARLTGALQARARACTGRPLLIAVDAEGGSVMRLGPGAGYTPTLPARELGEANDLALTELEARRIARMLREAGINWNLAPVVDVGYNPTNPVIVGHGRSYGANPDRVTAHARAFVQGMRAEGVLTSLKHFPGHGSSREDSHAGFVDVTETARPELELIPYRALLAEGLVDSVMTAHVVNRRLDRRRPATLSRPIITGLLRRELGWQGVVVSDDLRMGAIDRRYGMGDAAVQALRAGVDLLLVSEETLPDGRSASAAVLKDIRRALGAGPLKADRVADSLKRVEALKARLPR